MKEDYREKYEEYIHSAEWNEKRKQKAEEQKYRCERCDKFIPKGFHIHHKTYKNFGHEDMKDLQLLCEDCHINVHCKIKNFKNNIPKKKKDKKSCENCYYSQRMKYKGAKTSRSVLYCNKKLTECECICRYYRKGSYKKVKPKNSKNKRKT